MLGDGPDGVVAGHQNIVLFGCCQLLFEPGHLTAGHSQVLGHFGLLTGKVIRVATQHHCVQHEDGHSYVCTWNFEAQTVVGAGEIPVGGTEAWGKHFKQRHTDASTEVTGEGSVSSDTLHLVLWRQGLLLTPACIPSPDRKPASPIHPPSYRPTYLSVCFGFFVSIFLLLGCVGEGQRTTFGSGSSFQGGFLGWSRLLVYKASAFVSAEPPRSSLTLAF